MEKDSYLALQAARPRVCFDISYAECGSSSSGLGMRHCFRHDSSGLKSAAKAELDWQLLVGKLTRKYRRPWLKYLSLILVHFAQIKLIQSVTLKGFLAAPVLLSALLSVSN